MRSCPFAWVALVALASCGDAGPVRQIPDGRTFVPVPAKQIVAEDPAARFGGGPAENQAPLTWEVPAGWQERSATAMRLANFGLGDSGGECYISLLRGGGGQSIGNINRWRGQMGAEPLDAAGLAALPRRELAGGSAIYMEVEGTYRGAGGAAPLDDQKMAVLLLEAGGHALTVKMVGPVEVVDRELDNFDRLRRSIRFREAAAAAGAAPIPGFSPGRLAWHVPASWTPGGDKPMRLATLHPAGQPEVDCSVTVLPGDGGGEEANITRWYGQMGQSRPSRATYEALPTVNVLGRPCKLVDVRGSYTTMSGARSDDYAMLGVVCGTGSHTVFVKMTGPGAAVDDERSRFVEFCKSFYLK